MEFLHSLLPIRLSQPSVRRLFKAFGIEPELLRHLDKLLGSLRILDGLRQTPGSVGLVSVVIGLGHGSTFHRMSTGCPQKGSNRQGAGIEFVFTGLFRSLNPSDPAR